MTHTEARDIFARIWLDVVGRDYSTQELVAVMSVAAHETGYGTGWKAAMVGSHNMGAFQCNHVPDANGHCPPGCAPYGDSHANGQKYAGCFKTYPSSDAGARDMLAWFARKPEVLDAAITCVMFEFARAMHDRHYFEGSSTDPDKAILGYAGALMRSAQAICTELGEENFFVLTGPKVWPAIGNDGGGENA